MVIQLETILRSLRKFLEVSKWHENVCILSQSSGMYPDIEMSSFTIVYKQQLVHLPFVSQSHFTGTKMLFWGSIQSYWYDISSSFITPNSHHLDIDTVCKMQNANWNFVLSFKNSASSVSWPNVLWNFCFVNNFSVLVSEGPARRATCREAQRVLWRSHCQQADLQYSGHPGAAYSCIVHWHFLL